MTALAATRTATRLVYLCGASAIGATIVIVAPEVGAITLGALITAWVALGVARLVVLIGVLRQFYESCCFARAA